MQTKELLAELEDLLAKAEDHRAQCEARLKDGAAYVTKLNERLNMTYHELDRAKLSKQRISEDLNRVKQNSKSISDILMSLECDLEATAQPPEEPNF